MFQTACFSREQLRDFSLGCISAEEEARMAAHLNQCESCQQAAAECDCSADSLVAALRLPEDALSDDDVHCDAALARAKQLAAGSVDARHERTEPIRLREYELLRKLGEGGMGTVYLARHTRLDRIVALKILPPDRMRDASAVARFEREMRAVGGLDHPAIVRATDAGDVDGTHFLVMEYVEGLDLSSLVERLGPIGIADACELVRQAALGLQHVHVRGMVHRDIKPSNLMLTARGEVKILDLGLALLQRGDGEVHGITTVGRFMGTLDYMAPEQADDSHEVDIRADVYGMGATLYRLICGLPPFAGREYRSPLKKLKALATEPVRPVRERRPEVPAGLAQVIERMLAKEPHARFCTPAEMADALAPFAAGSSLAELQRTAESSQLAPQADSSLAEQVHDSQRSERRSGSTGRIRWLVPALLALAALIAGAAIYVETDRGTLVIKSPDPGIEVLIRRNEKPVDDWELQRGENRTTVHSGSYEIILIGASDGLRVKNGTFTLTRGGEHVAMIERVGQEKKLETVREVASPIRSVGGTVIYRSEPVEGANVTFAPSGQMREQKIAVGHTDAAGKFQVRTFDDGALPPGEYKILVSKLEISSDAGETPTGKHVLPERYSTLATTPFTRTVTKDGENLFTLELSDAERPGEPDRVSFNLHNAPWRDVLKLLAENAGLTLDMRDVPPGTFSYRDPREYTPTEALDVLNGYLVARGYVLVRRDNFLVSLKIGDVPANLIPTVTIEELPQRGRNELLNVIFPLEGVKAEDWVDEVRSLLDVVGSKGQVTVLERSNAITVTDFGGNLRRVHALLGDVLARPGRDESTGESLQRANVLGLSLRQATPREIASQTRYRGGLVVEQVRPSSPASAAGIRIGDVLVGLGERETTTIDNVHSAVQRATAANLRSLKFYIVRDGGTAYGTLTIPDPPVDDAPAGESAGADRGLRGRIDSAGRADREHPLTLERGGRRYVVDFKELTVTATDMAPSSVLWRTTVSQLRDHGDWHLELFFNELLELRRFAPDRDTRVTLNALTGAIVDSETISSAEARQTISNLRALASAMNEYQKRAEHPWLPPGVLLGPDGKTPHSWRVELLPFLGHTELFQEYRLDEPWNSGHNLKLLDKMPAVFRHPNDPPSSADTPYQVATGDWKMDRSPTVNPSGNVGLPLPRVNTLFSSVPQREGLRMQDIIDGTANTLLIVEYKKRVPWTKPEDIPVSDVANLKLGGIWFGGFYAALADTTVNFLPTDIEPEMLRRLLSPTDGEVIDWDSLRVIPPGHKSDAARRDESRKDHPPDDHADERNTQGDSESQGDGDRIAAEPDTAAAVLFPSRRTTVEHSTSGYSSCD